MALDSLGLPQCCPAVGRLLRWPGCGWVGEPRAGRAGGDGTLPRDLPGWLRPPPLFTLSGTSVSQARSVCEAGHVFSFSPDNDSGRRWAASRCAQLCPGHSRVPGAAGAAGPGPCTWPLGQPGHVPSPGRAPAGHGPCQPPGLCLCFAWHSLSRPRLPSWPGAGSSAAPVLAPGLSLSLSLLCGSSWSPGLSHVGSSAPHWKWGLPILCPPEPQDHPTSCSACAPPHAGRTAGPGR